VTYPSRAEVIQYTSPQLEILTVPSQCQEGQDHNEGDDDAGVKAEFSELEKYLSTDAEPSPDPIDESPEPPKHNLK